MNFSQEHFMTEALRISDEAEKNGIQLRLLGSLAFRIHCPKYISILDQMERELTDIDYMGISSQSRKFKSFMAKMGYEMDNDIIIATDGSRYFFSSPETGLGIDIFVDKLAYCHTVHMENRLGLDSPTISLVDMLLEKMQIVEINPKDIKDTVVLLLEHSLGTHDDSPEQINLNYLCEVLGKDWGFHQTFVTNMQLCKRTLVHLTSLTDDHKSEIADKIDAILSAIERKPKTLRWKMRSKIGTRVKWYREVNIKDKTF